MHLGRLTSGKEDGAEMMNKKVVTFLRCYCSRVELVKCVSGKIRMEFLDVKEPV